MGERLRLEGLTLTVESVERSLDFHCGKLHAVDFAQGRRGQKPG